MTSISNSSRRMINNIVASFIVKGAGLLINFFAIPLYMKYFENNSILGVWFTILSILSWVLTFDLGIGNGLRNKLVEPLAKNDINKIKEYLSSSYIILGIGSIAIAIIGLTLIYSIDLHSFFNINKNIIDLKVLRLSLLISFLGISIQFFLKLVLSILNAMEKTAFSNFVVLLSNIINLIYLLMKSSGNDAEKLFKLSIVYSLSVNIPLLVCTIIIFSTLFKGMIPRLKYFDKNLAVAVLNLGSSFFLIQMLFMIITSSNEFFISNVFGAEKVVEFQVYNKIYYTIITLYSLITNPIWSAVTRSFIEGKIEWIKKLYKKLMIISFIISACVIFVGFFFQSIVNIWLGKNSIIIRFDYIVAFTFYIIVMIFVFSLNSIANGIQSLKPQIVGYSFSVIFKIIIIYSLNNYFNNWIVVIWINSLTLLPYVLWQCVDLKKKLV